MFWNKLFCFACVAAVAFNVKAAVSPEHSSYEATVYTLPDRTAGTAVNRVCLDGKWQVTISSKGLWHNVRVPGELAMQGLAVNHDTPAIYRRKFTVPADFAGKKIILRFNGAYSYATLKVNGKEVRKHRGGFTRWDTDVTGYIFPGKTNEIELTLIDPVEEISYASGYAHHPICGILRSVMLYAQPRKFFTDLKVDADLDTTYTAGTLRISMNCDMPDAAYSQVDVSLIAPDGRSVADSHFDLHSGLNSFAVDVKNPLKWDAEHPQLYKVRLKMITDGNVTAEITRQVGFRKIEIKGARMLVNGMPVKLRGACRHDIHSDFGRATDRSTDSIDVRLFKESNMNFVRTSHYPPSEDFLEFCDRYGIYVESETAVCFVDTHRQKNYAPGATQSDSTHTTQYLGQLSEMAKNFQSHPSILFWSIGNESKYGDNFRKSYDWIKSYDTTRPVIFSYPGSVPEGEEPVYDIASMHYQDVNGNLWQWGVESRCFEVNGFPTLFDEWAHPACYTYTTLQHDPGIREFWGKSLDMMWDGVYNKPGALGGAIWGYIDELFYLPKPKEGIAYWKEFAHTAKPEGFRGDCVGYGEWGIVDVFRRKKPEFWATKKAYSPVRIESPRYIDVAPGLDLMLNVFNRFDHTDLSETKAAVTYKGRRSIIEMPSAAPHSRGALRIPANNWQNGDTIGVEIVDAAGNMLDRYLFTVGPKPIPRVELPARTPMHVTDSAGYVVVENSKIRIPFDTTTGLICGATVEGDTVITEGPYLNAYINYNHLTGAEVRRISDHITASPADWHKTSFDTMMLPSGDVVVTIEGTYNDLMVKFDIVITPTGKITTAYSVVGVPDGYLRETGIAFTLPDNFCRLKWRREGYWDNYPADAMSGNTGDTPLYDSLVQVYGERPLNDDWASDTKDYYYWSDNGTNATRPLTMRAKAMKENIENYTLVSDAGKSLTVISPSADVACRLDKPNGRDLVLFANNRWDYPEIAWGNYCKVISPIPLHGQITMLLK